MFFGSELSLWPLQNLSRWYHSTITQISESAVQRREVSCYRSTLQAADRGDSLSWRLLPLSFPKAENVRPHSAWPTQVADPLVPSITTTAMSRTNEGADTSGF